MEEVAVHRVGLAGRGFDVDALLFAVGDHFGTAGELGAENGHAPGGDDLQVRGERRIGELETHLVVTFAGGPMRYGVGLFGFGDGEVGLGDERTGDGGAEVILAFVDRVGAQHRVDVVAGKLLDQVHRVVGAGTGLFGLIGQTIQLFFLADIGGKGDDLSVVVIFEPADQDRGVEAARIGEDDFHAGNSPEACMGWKRGKEKWNKASISALAG